MPMKIGNSRIARLRGVAMPGMAMPMAGGSMIMVAVPRMVVSIGLMVMSAAAGMIVLFDLWQGGVALRQREKLIAQPRDSLGYVWQQIGIGVMLDRHGAGGDRDGNILDALQAAHGCVDFRGAGSAIHAFDAIAALLCCRRHLLVPD